MGVCTILRCSPLFHTPIAGAPRLVIRPGGPAVPGRLAHADGVPYAGPRPLAALARGIALKGWVVPIHIPFSVRIPELVGFPLHPLSKAPQEFGGHDHGAVRLVGFGAVGFTE